MSVIKRRSCHYNKEELDCLISYIEDNPELLCSKLGGQYKSMNDIRLAWDELAEKLTAVRGFFGIQRTGQEVKRKWSDLKSRVKAKAATIAMETDEGTQNKLKLSPVEERVLSIITQKSLPMSDAKTSALGLQEIRVPAVKVYSFHNNSNSEDIFNEITEYDGSERNESANFSDSETVEEIKVSGNEDKKRRISDAFSTAYAERKALNLKKLKTASEEEQLQELCKSQIEINVELCTIKDILKKCQSSIEKLALLKRAELRLKCAKYGVDFEDLFD